MTSAYAALRAARDQLLAARADHDRALADFSWPDVGERFNWAHDWFDVFARGNDTAGLAVVEEDGSAASYTFSDLVNA